ncbi:MAG: type VI secretion system domain-containing protein, partial [Candidatus Eiseniibacteriota bacterium]
MRGEGPHRSSSRAVGGAVLRLAAVVLVLVAAGCATSRTASRAPEPESDAEPSVRVADRGAAAEARRLAGMDRLPEAESLLRGAVAAARTPKDRAASRLALAELLEGAARGDEALALHLESIAEGEGAAAGWAGVARVRRAAGDEVG